MPGTILTKCLKVLVKMQTESPCTSSQSCLADGLVKHLHDLGSHLAQQLLTYRNCCAAANTDLSRTDFSKLIPFYDKVTGQRQQRRNSVIQLDFNGIFDTFSGVILIATSVTYGLDETTVRYNLAV